MNCQRKAVKGHASSLTFARKDVSRGQINDKEYERRIKEDPNKSNNINGELKGKSNQKLKSIIANKEDQIRS